MCISFKKRSVHQFAFLYRFELELGVVKIWLPLFGDLNDKLRTASDNNHIFCLNYRQLNSETCMRNKVQRAYAVRPCTVALCVLCVNYQEWAWVQYCMTSIVNHIRKLLLDNNFV